MPFVICAVVRGCSALRCPCSYCHGSSCPDILQNLLFRKKSTSTTVSYSIMLIIGNVKNFLNTRGPIWPASLNWHMTAVFDFQMKHKRQNNISTGPFKKHLQWIWWCNVMFLENLKKSQPIRVHGSHLGFLITTKPQNCKRNICGKFSDHPCSCSWEVQNVLANQNPWLQSWISYQNKSDKTSSGPLEQQLWKV